MNSVYVYVMAFREAGELVGPVKVGIAANPDSRRREIQTAHHREVVVIAQFLSPNRQIARELEEGFHSVMSRCRLRGEWFDMAPGEAVWAVWMNIEAALHYRTEIRGEELERTREKIGIPAVKAFLEQTIKGPIQ